MRISDWSSDVCSSDLFAASCLLLAAMAALFAAMLQRWFYLAMCFAPLAWNVLGSFALRIWGLDSLEVAVSTLLAPWQLPWLAVLAPLAAAWRWRGIVRDAGQTCTAHPGRAVVRYHGRQYVS